MLAPEVAARHLDIDFCYEEEIPKVFGFRGSYYEIAGLIDRQANKIIVSKRFPLDTIKFTGAHELGHWLLHPNEVMHRDRPIKGLANSNSRDSKEKEADYFAACYLMPRKLITKAMESTFRASAPLAIDDTAAFWLSPSDPDSILRAENGSLNRALAVASARTYGGRHFYSLAQQFNVSATSMALRLQELNLIRDD